MELKHSFGTVVACGLVEQLERCGLKVRGLVGPDGQVVPALYCFSDSLPGRLWQSQSTQPFWLPCACSAAPDLSASHLCQCAETAHWAAKVHCSSQQLPDTDHWDLPCSATWDIVEMLLAHCRGWKSTSKRSSSPCCEESFLMFPYSWRWVHS